MSPLFELILNPFAGGAGFILLSFMFYTCIALCLLVWAVERNNRF